MKQGLLIGLLVVGCCGAAPAAITLTLGEFSSPPEDPGTYYNDYLVGTYTYDLTGLSIVSAVITGQWGNSGSSTTAHNEMWLDGVLLANTNNYSPSPYNTSYTTWSHTFSESELGVLADGQADLHTIQTSEYVVRLGETTLAIETAPAQVIPAPGALMLSGLGTGLVGWLRRRRKV